MAAVYMYMLRCGSRNSMNENRSEKQYRRNYKQLFGLRLPHLDTVDSVLERLEEDVLDKLKRDLIRMLMSKRVFHKYRMKTGHFTVAVDGSGVYKFDHEPYPGCPYHKKKNGKTWYQNVLEAKLVTSNGFSISLGTEWMVNEEVFTKQDCEYKAAMRLFKKLKSQYPRLQMCLLLDGLYAKDPIMKAIKSHGWEFIIVWKDKTMYSKQDEVQAHREDGKVNMFEKEIIHDRLTKSISKYEYCCEKLDYKGNSIYYLKQIESYTKLNDVSKNKTTKFVFMTSIACNATNNQELILAGRLRWKIENEGFNAQKRQQYKLHHKINRKSLMAIKNYYNCLQIAHLFDQLFTMAINGYAELWSTARKMWEYFTSALRMLQTHQIPINLTYPKLNYRY